MQLSVSEQDDNIYYYRRTEMLHSLKRLDMFAMCWDFRTGQPTH